MKNYIETVIAPRLQGDGGWPTILELRDDYVKLQLQGECSKCNMAPRCMKWIEEEIARDLGRTVTVEFMRKKPFFQDIL